VVPVRALRAERGWARRLSGESETGAFEGATNEARLGEGRGGSAARLIWVQFCAFRCATALRHYPLFTQPLPLFTLMCGTGRS